MKLATTHNKRNLFTPILQSKSLQAATMVLNAGQASSECVENEHPKAEQWLFVIAGSGVARVGVRSVKLKAGSLLLIERRERHQVVNTGKEPMVTLNFYSPPAYNNDGEVKRL